MATLEQILFYRNLTGVVQLIKSGLPNPLPPEFMTPGRQVPGNRAEYYTITGTRQTAQIVQYGSPAARRGLRDIGLVPVTLLHTFQSQQWPLALTLQFSKMNVLERDKLGEQQAQYQTVQFKKLFANLRIVAALQCLFNGIIYSDGSGNVLPYSLGNGTGGGTGATAVPTTAVDTINYGVPSTNQGILKDAFGATIIDAGWQTSTTKIITHLQKVINTSEQLTGYKVMHAFYGTNVAEYIGANATAQQYLKLNPAMNQAFINTPTAVPNGFGGIANWHYAGDTFYSDASGTTQPILGANAVVFTPDYDPEWFEIFEGSFPVPTTILPQMGADAATVLSNVAEVFGMFGYGQLGLNPPSVEQFGGDTFLPVLKVPKAVFQACVYQ